MYSCSMQAANEELVSVKQQITDLDSKLGKVPTAVEVRRRLKLSSAPRSSRANGYQYSS